MSDVSNIPQINNCFTSPDIGQQGKTLFKYCVKPEFTIRETMNKKFTVALNRILLSNHKDIPVPGTSNNSEDSLKKRVTFNKDGIVINMLPRDSYDSTLGAPKVVDKLNKWLIKNYPKYSEEIHDEESD